MEHLLSFMKIVYELFFLGPLFQNQCFRLMGALINSHDMCHDRNFVKQKHLNDSRLWKKIYSWPTFRSILNQPLKLSKVWKETCQSNVKIINQWLLCHWSHSLSVQPYKPLSVMFITSQPSVSTIAANSCLSEPSIKTPAWLLPFSPPLVVDKPSIPSQDQTARLCLWLRLLTGSYGNGHLSPHCLIG